MPQELMYQIALTRIPLIGDVIIKKLLEHFGSAGEIFKAKRYALERIETVGAVRAAALLNFRDFEAVEAEMAFLEKYRIQPLFFQEPGYPQRLLHCYDSPAMLYYKGPASLNPPRMVSIVGTRHPSAYGRSVCEALVQDLASAGITIVSGLAYGIDIIAHKAALKTGIPTIGVLAHGLDRIYPAAHKQIATDMLEQGGLLTDFSSQTLPDRQNFPKRNRIVAGICDATIVIESGIRGGSLITADLANGYNREVLCVPGRIQDIQSAGCNHLIQQNKAVLLRDAGDVLALMGWEEKARPEAPPAIQPSLFPALTEAEQAIMALFREKPQRHLEELYLQTRLSGSQVAVAVFNLEMQNLLRSLPGQRYERV
ncbi:DNA-protecting protein DprA [Chitinophaga polysaccharea]|uniref:DNA-processing protein DprA n=1 Tax=Chitinophaga TaxID=79328 RepID=UPI0014552F6B|nr:MULTISPECIES: DNA-processing protein DprA [Chitinophaga]NLR56692.1 DNA-protecting protein DprA [Chitinophaga polysaccharea]NLU92920.1 DNA-protecting protein DprA [Chitinophaga sp. Ak27]